MCRYQLDIIAILTPKAGTGCATIVTNIKWCINKSVCQSPILLGNVPSNHCCECTKFSWMPKKKLRNEKSISELFFFGVL